VRITGDDRPVGVFDSGVGGLTVVRALRERLPNEGIVYVGDTARAPYGGLSADTLLAYSREIIGFLLRRGVKAVVLACGTTSSTVYDTLCGDYPGLPLVDVIRPGVATVRQLSQDLRIGFIATEATVKKGLLLRLLREEYPDIEIESRACPLFAPLAELGDFTSREIRRAAKEYLSDWRGGIDALLLGCTHYPLLAEAISEVLPSVPLADLSDATAREAAERLKSLGLLRGALTPPSYEYYVSGPPEKFNPIALKIFGETIAAVKMT
jgi:glutamate racemase